MGVPTYVFPKSLLPIWWKPFIMMGYADRREEEHQQIGSGWIAHEVGIIRTGTTKTLLTITEMGSSCLVHFADNPPLSSDYTHLGVLWYPSIIGRQTARSVERTLLSSGAVVAGEPMGCRLLYLCSRELVKYWPEYFNRDGFTSTVLSSITESSNSSGEEVISTNGIVKYKGSGVRVFSGLGINPDTNQYHYYIALDYSRGMINRWFQSERQKRNSIAANLATLLQQHRVTKVSMEVQLHWNR